ncbi:hypothetical protein E2562_024805 [Oryza meyeriana var. granulata]|uniref:Uncharacterized protein n=1 Tax=Oryza meyeriana var. granulata TaxID=110450 RepID=A0A6G1FBJ3_9ORYZ|nr:hypothetical protein E2562_024805 [Oryza meyeriana var. granulata]
MRRRLLVLPAVNSLVPESSPADATVLIGVRASERLGLECRRRRTNLLLDLGHEGVERVDILIPAASPPQAPTADGAFDGAAASPAYG